MQVVFTDPNRPCALRRIDPDMMTRRHVLSVFEHPDLLKQDRSFEPKNLSLAPKVWFWLRKNFTDSVVNIYVAESHVRFDFETSEQAALFSMFVIH